VIKIPENFKFHYCKKRSEDTNGVPEAINWMTDTQLPIEKFEKTNKGPQNTKQKTKD
jgi:hypothetical protein